ncbi:MAG: ABC transporter permease [Lachnospiraceae bacterium]
MGQFSEYVKMALYNIKENKGRSFLTMLGIIIGISSVIAIISIGSGLKSDVMSQTETKSVAVTVDAEETTNLELITLDDLQALKTQLGSKSKGVVAQYSSMATASVTTQKGDFDAYLTLTTADAEYNPNSEKVIRGAYFSEDDVLNAQLVCVLDKGSALYLFGTTDVIGLDFDVVIDNTIQTVTIKGVRDLDSETMEAMETQVEMFGIEMPVYLELPYTVAESWGEKPENFSSVNIYLGEGEDENAVAKSAIQILTSRHLNDGDDLFTKQQDIDYSSVFGTVLDGVTAFIAIVAGISLLVGGIGVMNIMLVSVTERTREIGIRRALGAKSSSIIMQFLLESAIISGVGGVIGIAFGAGIAGLVSALNIAGLSAKLSVSAIILTTCFSCGVGIVFGIYPARKAAKMSPMEALRRM